MRRRRITGWLLGLALLLALAPAETGVAQAPDLPGVRGWFYESPTYGWSMIADPAIWMVKEATSGGGIDTVILTGQHAGSPLVSLLVETSPGSPDEAEFCLADFEQRMLDVWPQAAITRAIDDATGEEIYYSTNPGEHRWMAAYLVDGIPGTGGTSAIEVYCDPVSTSIDAIIGMLAIMPAARYDDAWPLVDGLRSSVMEPGYRRQNEARPDGRPPLLGVLEFGVPCGRPHPLLNWPDNDIRSFFQSFPVPGEPLPAGTVWVAHVGFAGNVDGIPSLLNLNHLIVARSVRSESGWVTDWDGPIYTPRYYTWLWGVARAAPEVAMLMPGDSALYLVWFIVERPVVSDDPFLLDVRYQPSLGAAVSAGHEHIHVVEGDSYDFRFGCGGGGGSRPRIRIGD